MYFLLNMGIFQPATLVLPEGIHIYIHINIQWPKKVSHSFIGKKVKIAN